MQGTVAMPEHARRAVEAVGSSATGTDDAIAQAAHTVRHTGRFQLVETRGRVEDRRIARSQVTLESDFTLDDRAPR